MPTKDNSSKTYSRRRHLRGLSAAAVAALAGCSGNGGSTPSSDNGSTDGESTDGGNDSSGGQDGSIEPPVEYLTWGLGFMSDTITPWMNQYQEEYGNEATAIHKHEDPWHSLVQSRLQSNNAPHALDVWSYNFQLYLDLWEENVDRFFSDSEMDRFNQGLLENYQYDGSYYYLPYYYQIQNTWRRTQFFEQAGISEAPTTTDKYFDTAEKLVADSDAKYGLAHINWAFGYWTYFQAEGISMLNEDNSAAAFNEPRTVEILTRLRDLTSESVIPELTWTERKQPMVELFGQDDLGMFIAGGAELRLLHSTSGDAFEITPENVAITSAPGNKGLLTPTGLGVPNTLNDAEKEAGANVIKLLTSDDIMEEFIRVTTVAVGNENAMNRVLDDDSFTNDNPLLTNLWELYGDIAGDAYVAPRVESVREVWDAIHSNFQQAALGNTAPEQAVDQAEQQVNSALN